MIRQRPGHWLLNITASPSDLQSVGLLGADFEWNLPKGFPRPAVPADNPMSVAKVELGRYLFYDKRISVNGKEFWISTFPRPTLILGLVFIF